MVFYFTSTAVDPPAQIYVGKDKYENEDLIKYGLEEDVWCVISSFFLPPSNKSRFHVDNLSSAHIYYRLQPGTTWDKIPEPLLIDCAQLTKANSIDGNKKDNITIIYTPWSNLKKDGSMAVGQVSFHDQKKVKKVHVRQRENVIVNRLNKTKKEEYPDLRQEKEKVLAERRRVEMDDKRRKQKEDARIQKERKEAAWQRDHAYDDWNDEDALQGSSNQDRPDDFLDDFM